MTRHVAIVAALILVYALALASFHPWDLAIGTVLATVLYSVARLMVRRTDRRSGTAPKADPAKPPGRMPSPLERAVAFFPFAGAVTRDMLVGAWKVFLVTVHLRPPDRSMVTVPLEERTPTGVAVSALLAALVPGTVLIDVDEDARVMLIHAIDAADPDAAREEQQEFYRRYQRKVFP
ncbi:MAG: Na+/H+ antiporter subunit E [Rubrobacter sp.]|nr:Na+/H+ antiporter subunit E [Rubrobacter sp.]